MKRAAGAREHLDGRVSDADREASLADVERLNAWFGGHRLTLREIRRLATPVPPSRPLTVVDVGGGRGHFGRHVERWALRSRRRVRVVVVDREGPGPADLLRVRADATALPFREESVDVVTASLLLHHLEPDAAARCLGEMRTAARLGVVVNDLLRSRLTLMLVWLATRVVARHRFARDDGPLSVRRAYSPGEFATLAEKAGITRARIRRYPALGRLIAVL